MKILIFIFNCFIKLIYKYELLFAIIIIVLAEKSLMLSIFITILIFRFFVKCSIYIFFFLEKEFPSEKSLTLKTIIVCLFFYLRWSKFFIYLLNWLDLIKYIFLKFFFVFNINNKINKYSDSIRSKFLKFHPNFVKRYVFIKNYYEIYKEPIIDVFFIFLYSSICVVNLSMLTDYPALFYQIQDFFYKIPFYLLDIFLDIFLRLILIFTQPHYILDFYDKIIWNAEKFFTDFRALKIIQFIFKAIYTKLKEDWQAICDFIRKFFE